MTRDRLGSASRSCSRVALFLGGRASGLPRGSGRGAGAGARGRATTRAGTGRAIGGSLDYDRGAPGAAEAHPDDWQAFASLGLAYVQQARITADPSYYPKAEGVLERSLARSRRTTSEPWWAWPRSRRPVTTSPLPCVGASARRREPLQRHVYGVIGDAQSSSAGTTTAFATFQRMVDLGPAWPRTRGCPTRASCRATSPARSNDAAAREAAGTPADAAWASFQLGEL